MKKEVKVKVNVVFTDGYQKRFTEACLKALKRRGGIKQASA